MLCLNITISCELRGCKDSSNDIEKAQLAWHLASGKMLGEQPAVRDNEPQCSIKKIQLNKVKVPEQPRVNKP